MNSKTTKSRDVPHPGDDSRACCRRLAEGQNHAIPDLMEALERENDPRLEIITERFDMMIQDLTEAERPGHYIAASWQALAVFCLRVMDDRWKPLVNWLLKHDRRP